MTFAEALALVLLWSIVADVLIIALIFWHGRQSMELNARLKNLRVLIEQERTERQEMRKQIQRFGASFHELLDILEMLFSTEATETKPEPTREPLEEHTTTVQSQQERKAALEGPLTRRIAKAGKGG